MMAEATRTLAMIHMRLKLLRQSQPTVQVKQEMSAGLEKQAHLLAAQHKWQQAIKSFDEAVAIHANFLLPEGWFHDRFADPDYKWIEPTTKEPFITDAARCFYASAQTSHACPDEHKDLEKSEALYKRALTLTKRAFGPSHQNAAEISASLGALYVDTNQPKECQSAFLDALKIFSELGSPRLLEVLRDFIGVQGHFNGEVDEQMIAMMQAQLFSAEEIEALKDRIDDANERLS